MKEWADVRKPTHFGRKRRMRYAAALETGRRGKYEASAEGSPSVRALPSLRPLLSAIWTRQPARRQWLIAFVCAATVTAANESSSILRDPDVPDGEVATYRIAQDGEIWEFTETTQIDDRSGVAVYRFTYDDPSERVAVVVERASMLPLAVETITTGPLMTINSSTDVEIAGPLDSDGIAVLSFSELKYLLRGYPFPSAPTLDIEFMRTEVEEESSIDFSIRVRYDKRELVEIEGRTIDTHRLELRMSARGILRVLNRLVPKTFYWYSVEAPHYLVAYEGSSGFPGSPKQRIELVGYSGWTSP